MTSKSAGGSSRSWAICGARGQGLNHSRPFSCHKAQGPALALLDAALPLWQTQETVQMGTGRLLAGASLLVGASSPWAETGGAGSSLFSYQQSDSRTVTPERKTCSGVSHCIWAWEPIAPNTLPASPVCQTRNYSLGNVTAD